MKRPEIHIKNRGIARIIRALLAIAALISYTQNNDSLFLLAGIFFGIQALLNISCPGGACSTGKPQQNEPLMKFDKYKPEK